MPETTRLNVGKMREFAFVTMATNL